MPNPPDLVEDPPSEEGLERTVTLVSKNDLPGVRAIVDGRSITPDVGWAGVRRIVLGAPSKSTTHL